MNLTPASSIFDRSSWSALADISRFSLPASAAASSTAFWSAFDRVSNTILLASSGVASYLWPVSEMYFCTSKSLEEWMFISGFSCPSTTPCWSAM